MTTLPLPPALTSLLTASTAQLVNDAASLLFSPTSTPSTLRSRNPLPCVAHEVRPGFPNLLEPLYRVPGRSGLVFHLCLKHRSEMWPILTLYKYSPQQILFIPRSTPLSVLTSSFPLVCSLYETAFGPTFFGPSHYPRDEAVHELLPIPAPRSTLTPYDECTPLFSRTFTGTSQILMETSRSARSLWVDIDNTDTALTLFLTAYAIPVPVRPAPTPTTRVPLPALHDASHLLSIPQPYGPPLIVSVRSPSPTISAYSRHPGLPGRPFVPNTTFPLSLDNVPLPAHPPVVAATTVNNSSV